MVYPMYSQVQLSYPKQLTRQHTRSIGEANKIDTGSQAPLRNEDAGLTLERAKRQSLCPARPSTKISNGHLNRRYDLPS